jgi:hypothetical protein
MKDDGTSLSGTAERNEMELQKIMTYLAILTASVVLLMFIMDAAAGIFGRNIAMDVLFIIGAGFLLWQGVETAMELR